MPWQTPAVQTEEAVINSPKIKVGIISDSHYNEAGGRGAAIVSGPDIKANWDEFINDMNNWGADVVFHNGDLVDHITASSQTEYSSWLTTATDYLDTNLDCPVHFSVGNHEIQYSTYGAWSQYGFATQSDTYYTLTVDGVRFIVLNTNEGTDGIVTDTQLAWLDTELTVTRTPTVIVMHHPPYEPGTNNNYDYVKNRANLIPLLRRDCVKHAFIGHLHHNGDWDKIVMNRDGFLHTPTPNAYREDSDASYDYTKTPYAKVTITPRYSENYRFGSVQASYSEAPTRTSWDLIEPDFHTPFVLKGQEGIGVGGVDPQNAGLKPTPGQNFLALQIDDGTFTKLYLQQSDQEWEMGDKYVKHNWATRFRRRGVLTSDTTLYGQDNIVGVDTSGGSVTITLNSNQCNEGQVCTIKDEGGAAGTNAITIDTQGSEAIDGGSSVTISTDYGSVDIYSDGDNFFSH
jgi:predicted phosphodiesterase